jgi:hypothetical protein
MRSVELPFPTEQGVEPALGNAPRPETGAEQRSRDRAVGVGVSCEANHSLDAVTEAGSVDQAPYGEAGGVDGPAPGVVAVLVRRREDVPRVPAAPGPRLRQDVCRLERLFRWATLDKVSDQTRHEGSRGPGLPGGVCQARLGEGVLEGLLGAPRHHAMRRRPHHRAVALSLRVFGQGERFGVTREVVERPSGLVADVPRIGLAPAEYGVSDVAEVQLAAPVAFQDGQGEFGVVGGLAGPPPEDAAAYDLERPLRNLVMADKALMLLCSLGRA